MHERVRDRLPIQVALERRNIRVDPAELARVVGEALDAAGGLPHPLGSAQQ